MGFPSSGSNRTNAFGNEGRFNEVELLFIERELELHGEFMTDLLREEILAKTLIKDEDLLNSIDFTVSKYGIDPVLLINFLSYGRAIEIAYHKRRENTVGMSANQVNSVIWGIGQNRREFKRPKKDTRWYAKTAYGSINHLLSALSTNFSEEEKNRLKQILEKRYELKNR